MREELTEGDCGLNSSWVMGVAFPFTTFYFAYVQLGELHPLEYAMMILFHLDCSLEFYLPCTTWKL